MLRVSSIGLHDQRKFNDEKKELKSSKDEVTETRRIRIIIVHQTFSGRNKRSLRETLTNLYVEATETGNTSKMSKIAKLNAFSRFHRRLSYSNCNTTTITTNNNNPSRLLRNLLNCEVVKDFHINTKVNLQIYNDSTSGKRNGIVWKHDENNKFLLSQNKPFTLQSSRMMMITTTTSNTTGETISDTTNTQTKNKKTPKKFIPRKAAVALTEKARNLFKKLLQNRTKDGGGILLKLQQSTTGQPRMVFTFGFANSHEIGNQDEG